MVANNQEEAAATEKNAKHDGKEEAGKQRRSCCFRYRKCLIACGVITTLFVLSLVVLLTISLVMLEQSNKRYEATNLTDFLNETVHKSDASVKISTYPTSVFATPPFHICGGYAEVLGVFTDKCDLEDERCRIPREKDGTLEIVFKAVENITSATFAACARGSTVFANLGGCIPKKLANADVCKGYNIACPILADQIYVFRANDKVSESDSSLLNLMPNIYAILNHKIFDQNKKLVLCIDIPVIV